MTTRCDFLKVSAAIGAMPLWPELRPAAGLNLLILGGTGFIGPHLVRHALSRGHRVTTFTRGRRTTELPDGVIRLTGDRNGQLQALEGKTWDAVIDDSATNPDWVAASTALLQNSVGRYLFTSSTGVYYPYLKRGLAETDQPHLTMADPKDGSENYGVRKAQCEATVTRVFGQRGLVVRPTYIVGPGDTTDRFPYWPVRLAQGGDTLAPGRKEDPVQIIDVRDLAAFMVKLLEDEKSGVYNVAGPRETLTISGFLDQAVQALKSSSQLTWIDDYEFLKAHGIDGAVPWIMLEGNDLGHTSIQNARRWRPVSGSGRSRKPSATRWRGGPRCPRSGA